MCAGEEQLGVLDRPQHVARTKKKPSTFCVCVAPKAQQVVQLPSKSLSGASSRRHEVDGFMPKVEPRHRPRPSDRGRAADRRRRCRLCRRRSLPQGAKVWVTAAAAALSCRRRRRASRKSAAGRRKEKPAPAHGAPGAIRIKQKCIQPMLIGARVLSGLLFRGESAAPARVFLCRVRARLLSLLIAAWRRKRSSHIVEAI